MPSDAPCRPTPSTRRRSSRRCAGGEKITCVPALSSSCLAFVEYDYKSGIMYLRFCSARIYTLHGVPDYHYVGLLSASSPGWYFNFYLKGRY